MNVKDIEKMERTSLQRKFKEEGEETEKMNFDVYCILCQTYGHIPSKKCVVRAVCLNCGFKGHVRRDCKEGKRQIKNIKMEEIKRESVKIEEIKRESIKIEEINQESIKIEEIKRESINIEEIKRESIKIEEIKRESSNYENEYVEAEVPKDEPKNDALQLEMDSGITEIGKDIMKDGENIEITSNLEEEMRKDERKNYEKKIKVEVYCNLCQRHGHILSEACVVNAICFVCGIKGHVRRDCKEEKYQFKTVKSEVKREGTKYEEEYVEVEIKKDETKTEEQSKSDSEITKVEEDITSMITDEENNEIESSMNLTDIGENCEWEWIHSLRRCSVNLHKVTIKQYETASRKSNRPEKHVDISYASQKDSYQSQRKANFTHSLKKCTVKLPKVIKKQNKEDLSESNRQAVHKGVLYSCNKCSYEANYKSNLTRHIQAEHEGGVLYSCKKCSYEAKYKGNLLIHIQAEHGGVLYSCKKCSYETKYKRNLLRHIQAEHEGVTYSCKKCSYKTKYKGNLKRHMQEVH